MSYKEKPVKQKPKTKEKPSFQQRFWGQYKGKTIAVVGSPRERKNRERNVRSLIRSLPDDVTVITGFNIGVEHWAISAARKRGLKTKVFRASDISNAAMEKQYREIVEEADVVVAYPHWVPRGGVKVAIEHAKKLKKTVFLRA